MEYRQLKYFIKVAETLNFSQASKELFITQSTLSQQIRQLEQEMDAQLFMRDSHSVSLTEAGAALLPYARKVMYASNECFDCIGDLQTLQSGTLNIGATHTFCPILTESLVSFMRLYPKVKLNICYKTMEGLISMLERHELDLVLAFKPLQFDGKIESHVLFENHLAAIVKDFHPLASKSKVTLAELARYNIALPSKGMQARNAFDRVQEKFLTDFKVQVELNNVNILLKLIKQSELVTVLSEATIHDETGVKAIPLDFPGNEMEGCVHMLKNSYRKKSAQEFIKILSESAAIRKVRENWFA